MQLTPTEVSLTHDVTDANRRLATYRRRTGEAANLLADARHAVEHNRDAVAVELIERAIDLIAKARDNR